MSNVNSVLMKKAEETHFPVGHPKAGQLRVDKNGRHNKLITWTAPEYKLQDIPDASGKLVRTAVHCKARKTNVTCYEQSYLDNQPEFGFNIPVNQFIFGAFVTRKVKPYQVPDRKKGALPNSVITVDTATVMVVGETSDTEAFSIEIDKTFRAKGFEFETAPIQKVTEEGTPVDLELTA